MVLYALVPNRHLTKHSTQWAAATPHVLDDTSSRLYESLCLWILSRGVHPKGQGMKKKKKKTWRGATPTIQPTVTIEAKRVSARIHPAGGLERAREQAIVGHGKKNEYMDMESQSSQATRGVSE